MKYRNILLCLMVVPLIPAIAPAEDRTPGKGIKKIDTDGDGVITLAEAEEADAQKLIKHFDTIDGDGNGELTRYELRTHLKKRREAMDRDGNGAISYDEAAHAGAEKIVQHFDKLDINGDGEITRKEMRERKNKSPFVEQ
ncbi:MAG: EF-hand domain-containing protein [Opitutales bacterium]